MKAVKAIASMMLVLSVGACNHSSPTGPNYSGGSASFVSSQGSVKGAGGEMPAFYDGELFIINTLEISDVAGDRVAGNRSHNEIYVTNDLDEAQDFDPVIDAIQADGFNPMWEQVLIVFNPGVTPRQLTSDDEVDEAADAGEITLIDTHEMYRCSVVGRK